jgi:hypothetical protein
MRLRHLGDTVMKIIIVTSAFNNAVMSTAVVEDNVAKQAVATLTKLDASQRFRVQACDIDSLEALTTLFVKSQRDAQNKSVCFFAGDFVNAHGHSPRGLGNWAFIDKQHADKGDYLAYVLWVHDKQFSDAKRIAAKHFAKQTDFGGIVVVLS